jgi:hypothetical protein
MLCKKVEFLFLIFNKKFPNKAAQNDIGNGKVYLFDIIKAK